MEDSNTAGLVRNMENNNEHGEKAVVGNGTQVMVLMPLTGQCCMMGMYRKYSTDLPVNLVPYLSRELFEAAMYTVHESLEVYWPCDWAYGCYACIPCSFGLSLVLLNSCMDNVKMEVTRKMERVNLDWERRNIPVSMEFKSNLCSSWIELRLHENELSSKL